MDRRNQPLNRISRRRVVAGAGTFALAAPLIGRATAQSAGHVVVVGGGFGGATAARFLARSGVAVTLVERDPAFVTCPFSNTVLGGFNDLDAITFDHAALRSDGVTVVQDEAVGGDAEAGRLDLGSGDSLAYDRMILSPGVDLRFDAIPGYDRDAAQIMPHAWKAGPQTALLQAQIAAMDPGGVVAIAPPDNPYRCPPGPYERASLIAHYLTQNNPTAKVLILDAKESFSKMPLFRQAWDALYPGMIEWVPPSQGGRIASVEPGAMTLQTDFTAHDVDVANVIPPQRAGAIAAALGVADGTGWCPVRGDTFESDLVPGVHVIGDAAFAGAMPKSAFTANAQGKAVAGAVAALLRDETPRPEKLINTCYSLAAPDYGFTVAGVYEVVDGRLAEIEGAGGISPVEAGRDIRAAEADHARSWYATITREAFGAG